MWFLAIYWLLSLYFWHFCNSHNDGQQWNGTHPLLQSSNNKSPLQTHNDVQASWQACGPSNCPMHDGRKQEFEQLFSSKSPVQSGILGGTIITWLTITGRLEIRRGFRKCSRKLWENQQNSVYLALNLLKCRILTITHYYNGKRAENCIETGHSLIICFIGAARWNVLNRLEWYISPFI